MKKRASFLIVACLLFVKAFADEGMWLPQLLATLNEKEMKKMGMKISASDIYNINKGSLKDAIVSFGGFCTAEVISDKGLLLTNHHCGFDAIQNHTTLQNNYIRDGFWAGNYSQELVNPGLTATFIVRIDEITTAVLNNVTGNMTEKERQSMIDKNIDEFKKAVKKENYQDVLVKPFFEGNKYYLFITETYKDVRLVGAPPSSIGNFGKDTDNWMWPRHTGDFSIFRIYAGKGNKPADYSADNVPYLPKRSLNISLDGVKEGDFTMVFGFPGKTTEYLHSSAVAQIMNVSDPVKIAIRGKALQVLDGFMRKDEQIKIQYAAKYSGIENAYKKWKGEILGLGLCGAVDKKKMQEAEFEKIIAADAALNSKYGGLLQQLKETYSAIEAYGYARDYYNEITPRIELFTIASKAWSIVTALPEAPSVFKKTLSVATAQIDGIFKEYNAGVDQKLFEVLMEMYVKGQPEKNVSPVLKKMLLENNNSFAELAKTLYAQTAFTHRDRLPLNTNKPDSNWVSSITSDPAAILYNDIRNTYSNNISKKLNELQATLNQFQRTYVQAQTEVFKNKIFYPDANSTLRVAYGNVKSYKPRDGVNYHYYTYLDGVMEKYKPGDYEFDVPEKLIELYHKKDFGRYAFNGKQPVCFIAANHTTGGNSGSPALDAYGNLVGLNFDRVWEGTMSDINYNKDICRNVMVDIRYVLFIIDKFAGAKNIIDELKLVSKKKPK